MCTSIIHTAYPLRVVGVLGLIPADIEREEGFTQDRSPENLTDSLSHSESNSKFFSSPTNPSMTRPPITHWHAPPSLPSAPLRPTSHHSGPSTGPGATETFPQLAPPRLWDSKLLLIFIMNIRSWYVFYIFCLFALFCFSYLLWFALCLAFK